MADAQHIDTDTNGGPLLHHDPSAFIQLLRDHLAAPDRRLAFLFGAGTSSSINVAPPSDPGQPRSYVPLIPAVLRMTEVCKEAIAEMSPEFSAAWLELESQCEAMHHDSTIERLLGRLRLKIAATGPTDTALGLKHAGLLDLEKAIRKQIAVLAAPRESDIPSHIPHDLFARWVGRARRAHAVEIFTTNYDILFERSLERQRVPTFDGFVGSFEPYFSPDTVADDTAMPDANWTRVWKLHGSINWRVTDLRTVRTYSSPEGDMILPSHQKYDESRKMPYLALMDRLANLVSIDGTLLVTSGYAWNDEHINAAVLTAMDKHPSNAVIALMFSSLDEYPHLVSLAMERDNVFVIGLREGVIRRELAPWALPGPISASVASFVDLSFDSDALFDSQAPVTGEMKLGDFVQFCAFLDAMSRSGASL